VLKFCDLGLKTPIHAPKIGGFGGKIGEVMVRVLTPNELILHTFGVVVWGR